MVTQQDAVLFHRLYQPLLVYAAQRTSVASGVRTTKDLPSLGKDKLIAIRDQCYGRQDLIEQFCQANPFGFTPEDLESVRMWKHHVKGTFFAVKVTKEGALFLDERKDGKAYLVQPLLSTFEELLPARPPVRMDAVLLPFKGRIVYDGLLGTYPIYFGGGMSRSIRAACDNAIVRHGLVRSLPYVAAEGTGFTDEEKLLFYMKTAEKREEHYDEVAQIIRKNRGLLLIYHREMGRANARRHHDMLREVGVQRGWFAIADDVIVASGVTKDDVEKAVDAILPQEKRRAVHLFELK